MSKVVKIESENIVFDDGLVLGSYHDQDCCENHYLSMSDLSLSDFDGLEFDFSRDNFFSRINGYGIELFPVVGHSVRIPGYGSNNGYYSSNLDLVVKGNGFSKIFDISNCQEVSD